MRTIGYAYADFEAEVWEGLKRETNNFEDESQVASVIEKDLTLCAILGQSQTIKAEVPHAVSEYSFACITTRMITGDNIVSARVVAEYCGIISERDQSENTCMEGHDFMQKQKSMSESELKELASQVKVLARATPEAKQAFVSCLQNSCGRKVAYIGSGTVDAPAMKEATVGFSCGVAGTDVAKEAGDMMLMMDNMSDIMGA